jgi:hypothetical protein
MVGLTSMRNRLSVALPRAAPNTTVRTTTSTALRIRIATLSQIIDICAGILQSTCRASDWETFRNDLLGSDPGSVLNDDRDAAILGIEWRRGGAPARVSVAAHRCRYRSAHCSICSTIGSGSSTARAIAIANLVAETSRSDSLNVEIGNPPEDLQLTKICQQCVCSVSPRERLHAQCAQ